MPSAAKILSTLFLFLALCAGAFFYVKSKMPDDTFEALPASQTEDVSQNPRPQNAPLLQAKSPSEALQTAYAKFQTGDYEGAVYLLRLELMKQPDDKLLKSNLATALFSLAIFRVEQNRLNEAETLLEEAAKLGHFDSEHVLAAMLLKSGKLDSAAPLFENMYRKTKDKGVIKLLVDMALSQDDLQRSESYLTRLEEELQTRGEATEEDAQYLESRKKRLDSKKTFARNEEVIERNGIQVAFSDPAAKPAAEAVAESLEGVLEKLSPLLGPLPPGFRMRALLDTSFESANAAPPWAGALFDGFIRIPYSKSRASRAYHTVLARLARHEATHAYLYAHCGDTIPSWIGEGLAQRFEGKSVGQALTDLKQIEGKNAAVDTVPENLDGVFINASNKEVGSLYRRSLVLTEVLGQENGGDQFWREVLQPTCQYRVPIYQVLKERFGVYSARELWTKNSEKIRASIESSRL